MSAKGRILRHRRIRKKISGDQKRPRLYVYRSLKNLQAQLIDDVNNKTLLSMSTLSAEVKSKIKKGGNVKSAGELGVTFAKKAIEKGYSSVVFDRGGYKYHGRVKALADACRKGGLKF